MRNCLPTLVILLTVAALIHATAPVDLGRETEMLLPDGWAVDITNDDFPYMVEHDEFAAEMLISRTVIAEGETLNNPEELKTAVEFVLADVVDPLPNARLLTNTGFNDVERAGFVLEFVTDDSVNNLQIRHRLAGLIYRQVEGRQVLYTLWAKADVDEYGFVEADFWLMQQSFAMTVDHAVDVFATPTGSKWRYVPALLLLAALFLLIRKRRGAQDKVLPQFQHSFWRCSCGRLNPKRYDTCRRCGAPATSRSPV